MPKFNEDKQIQPLNGLGKTNGLANTWGYAQTPIKKKKKKEEEKETRKEKERKRAALFPWTLSHLSFQLALHYRSHMHLCQNSLCGLTVSYCHPSWGLKQNWETNKSCCKRETQTPHSGLFFPSSFDFLMPFLFGPIWCIMQRHLADQQSSCTKTINPHHP